MEKPIPIAMLLALLLAAMLSCRQPSGAQVDARLQEMIVAAGLEPPALPPSPDPDKVALGQALFFDKELSGNRDVSCATCHHPSLAAGDGLPLSIGPGGTGLGPARQAGEGRPLVPRNAIALFNRGLPAWRTMFWDGRVEAGAEGGFRTPAGIHLPTGLDSVLAAQAMFPVTFRDEMRGGFYDVDGYAIQPGTLAEDEDYQRPAGWHDVDVFGQPNELAAIPNGSEHLPAVWDGVMGRLLAIPAYQELFLASYPDVPVADLDFRHAANAIAAFEADAFTTLDSPWDRYLAGDTAALAAEAKAGALLFYGEAGCAACHSGPLFTDQQYHNLGVPQFGPGRDEFAPLDYGRYAVTRDPADRYAFRTPPLRNVALTGPWLHNGAYDALEDVIRHHLDPAGALRAYDGSHLPPELRATLQNAPVTLDDILATLDPRLEQLPQLSNRDVRQLLAFLDALTDPAATDMDHLVPDTVPSGLPVE